MSLGTYNIYNFAKFRIMEALYNAYPSPLNTIEIAQKTGMEWNKVKRLMYYYHTRGYRYFRRLKHKDVRTYRYKINKSGVKAYFEYVKRIKLGVDLNRRRPTPIKMETYQGIKSVKIKSAADLIIPPEMLTPYIRISKRGEYELGVTRENKLKIAGIIKDQEEDEVLDESLGSLDEPVKPPEMRSEPQVKKVKDKSLAKQKKEPKEPVKMEAKVQGKPQGKVSEKYMVLDLAPDELEYPEKVHTGQSGKSATSRQMAENAVYGLNDLDNQMNRTLDKNSLAKLQDKKRKLLLFLRYNPDIFQFVAFKQ